MRWPNTRELESLSRCDLRDLVASLGQTHFLEIERCVEFVLAETTGLGHGRARAKMCRRLKHCNLDSEQRRRLVFCITDRLTAGHFSQQFYDQLRLAIYLDQKRTFAAARQCLTSASPDYVRRFAMWVIGHERILSP